MGAGSARVVVQAAAAGPVGRSLVVSGLHLGRTAARDPRRHVPYGPRLGGVGAARAAASGCRRLTSRRALVHIVSRSRPSRGQILSIARHSAPNLRSSQGGGRRFIGGGGGLEKRRRPLRRRALRGRRARRRRLPRRRLVLLGRRAFFGGDSGPSRRTRSPLLAALRGWCAPRREGGAASGPRVYENAYGGSRRAIDAARVDAFGCPGRACGARRPGEAFWLVFQLSWATSPSFASVLGVQTGAKLRPKQAARRRQELQKGQASRGV